ncbi:RsmB/NOP family class I SAM-dependent RNA methyltransferase [Palleronia sp. KMU-117]|uniref:RsmB/NOP family class I SAM-dependent RNA methyltransferase n=1 Tax=Palleronia sp. KMU-117 TaxID=3434108 RepID=UPI003D71ECE3
MAKQGLGARRAACDLMTAVTAGHQVLSEAMPAVLEPLGPQDRARAQRLATEALRWAGRSDRLIGPYIRQRPPEEVLNILRLAVWEMLGDRAPSHAVVDSAVEITRARPETRRTAGMVNAVLRNILRGDPDWDALAVPPLPKWLRKPLLADYGKGAVEAIEAAHARGAPLDLTAKAGHAEDVARATGGTLLPTGSVRLGAQVQVSALPGFAEGHWWVQDAAAALPARVLDPRSGERILDLCAAPGGKTLQLADAGAVVTALDVSGARLARLRENLARTGLAAEVIEADALTWDGPADFDAVLLDAPCSATGTIRRHPDLPFAKIGADLSALVSLQARLIDRALDLVRPGGRVVFCTCSLLKDEGERQIEAALTRHPGLRVAPVAAPGIGSDWLTPAGAVRLRPDFWPELGGMDGFFIARLEKPGQGAKSAMTP